jgi:hypothetical protein
MTPQLLPPNFEEQIARAIRAFWVSRDSGSVSNSQGGSRDAVIGGKNMGGFEGLVRSVAIHCGLPEASVLSARRNATLPGFFRPTKNWDTLVIHQRRLIAVFEFKSQVGSFGNNFNNRSEEAIGSAADLWVAHERHAFRSTADSPPDPRPPFLGWLMLLEDSPASTAPVTCEEPHYPVFPEFRGASYADRYRILSERLMERQLYTAAALIVSEVRAGSAAGAYRSLSEATSVRAMFLQFAAHALAAVGS